MICSIKNLENKFNLYEKLRFIIAWWIQSWLDMFLVFIFVDFLHFPVINSSLISWIIVFISFILQKFFVFKSNWNLKKEILRFTIYFIVFTILWLSFLYLLNTILWIYYLFAILIIKIVFFVTTYFISKYFIFKKYV